MIRRGKLELRLCDHRPQISAKAASRAVIGLSCTNSVSEACDRELVPPGLSKKILVEFNTMMWNIVPDC